MSPDALTSPPPGSASGLNFFEEPRLFPYFPRIDRTPVRGWNRITPTALSDAWTGLVPVAVRRVSMRKILTLLVVSSGLALAACNTIEGVGRDVQSVGETVADAAG